MKKFLLVLYIAIFSTTFTAQYTITKKSSVKMTQSEMEKSAMELERDVKKTFTTSGMANHFKRVEDKYKSKNMEEEIQNKFIAEVITLIALNAQWNITKIEFLSKDRAKITTKYKTPTINLNATPKYDKMLENQFKREMGYPLEKVNGKVLSAHDKQKIDTIIKKVAKKVINLELKRPVYNSEESTDTLEKINNTWRFVIN